ncbi:uncharacterized protein LOC121376480 [Gigantopelta aegis]|uniref:uncharacterized protein LOC121376480 n=1 Tax=Gigantopelta aegis TaxID=1735272 RepID=UPI001B887DF4|nr:uncharacterized protein LOC121376480 [Gigantopelta aegis]
MLPISGIHCLILVFLLSITTCRFQQSNDSTTRSSSEIRHIPYRSAWSSWGTWSVCSSTCGQGQMMRLRHCVTWRDNKYEVTAVSVCAGSDKQFKDCDVKNENDVHNRMFFHKSLSARTSSAVNSSLRNHVIAADTTAAPSTTESPTSTRLSEDDIWAILMKEIKSSGRTRTTNGGKSNTYRETTPEQWRESAKRRQPHHNEVAIVNRRNRKQNRFRVRGQCGPCLKTRNRIRQFCKSNFVSRVTVNSVEIIGNETRYDVGIVETYKNNIPLMHREYLWVTNLCKCPRLRVRRQYIVMGRTYQRNSRELRLSLDSISFVRRYSVKQKGRIIRLKKRKKCK